MPLTWGGSRKLITVVAVIQLSLGFIVFQFPHELRAPAFDPIRAHLPFFSIALMAGGVALLQWRQPLASFWQRALGLLRVLPLAVLAVLMVSSAAWSGLVLYALLALAAMAAPWLPGRAGGSAGRDLLSLAALVIIALTGGLMLLWPSAFGTFFYAPIGTFLRPAGALGLIGAAVLLRQPPSARWGLTLQRLAAAAFPALLTYNWAVERFWSGVIGWGALTIALLLGEQPFRPEAAPAAPGAEPEASFLPRLERILEHWTWLLALLAALMLAMAGSDAFARPHFAHLYILCGLLYNGLAYYVCPRLGSPALRVARHLAFLTLFAGLLHVSRGPTGHGYLVMLVVMPAFATQAIGLRAGQRLLVLAAAVVVGSEAALLWLGDGSLPVAGSSVLLQLLLLLAAASVGIRIAQAARVQQHQLERAFHLMRASESERARLVAILETTPDLVGMTEADGRTVYVNPAGRRLLGLPETGRLPAFMAGSKHPAWARDLIRNEGVPAAQREGSWSGETALLGPDGREIPLLQTIIAHPATEASEAFLSTVARDITERKRLEEQLRHAATHDPLTGLANRRQFQELLERHAGDTRPTAQPGALLLLDLDGFKFINDTFGHGVGDSLLCSLAALLEDQVPEASLVARLGGDEFALILLCADEPTARATAARLLTAIHRHTFLPEGRPVRLAGSIGIALFPEHGTSSSELLANADIALYQAKKTGRNTHAVYGPDPAWRAHMDARFVWEQRIHAALQENAFLLDAQPIWNLQKGEVAKFELLLRMQCTDGTVYPPSAFLGIAEELGLIHAIDRWVVRQAIRLLAAHRAAGVQVVLAVNLSGKAFSDPELLPLLEQEFERTGVDPGRLVLEITETAAVTDTSLALRFVRQLTTLGCRFAIDDFGAGFTSYALLKQLPVRYVKIDGSFIQNLPDDPVDQEFVRGMVNVAHGLGLEVVAEYVSNAETVEILRTLGVDHAQGYYLGKPTPVRMDACARAAATTLPLRPVPTSPEGSDSNASDRKPDPGQNFGGSETGGPAAH